jgi:hypothetical protein
MRDAVGNIQTDVLGKKWWIDNFLKNNFDFIIPKVSHKVAHKRADMFIIIDGPVGSGKCQPANSKVLMSDGEWKNIQDIIIGDKVISPQQDGTIKISTVLNTTNWFCEEVYDINSINKNKKLYSCSYNHPIPMHYKGKNDKEWTIKHFTPKEIIQKGDCFRKNNFALTSPPIENFGKDNCIIEPYTLGAMLGDGFSRYNFYTKIKALALHDELKSLGLIGKHSGDKFIPKEALVSDLNYRKRLLAGLIDTDGYKAEGRSYQYVSKSFQLANDIKFLVHSLGGRCGEIKKIIKKIKSLDFSGEYYMVSFNFPYDIDLPIQVSRKRNPFVEEGNIKSNRIGVHVLRSIKREEGCQVYGFELDGDSHWYITDNWMITHNTTLSFQAARYFDPTFCLDRVVFSVDEFLNVLINATPGQAVVFDEAIIVNSRSALTEFNKKVIIAMTQIRSKGLYIFFNIPSVFDLDRNLVLNRCHLLLHCYQDSFGDRGKFCVFDHEKMKLLYLKGKRLYTYAYPKANFVARFTEYFYLERIPYENKKQKEIAKQAKDKKPDRFKLRFVKLVRWLKDNWEIEETLQKRIKILATVSGKIDEAIIKTIFHMRIGEEIGIIE